MDAQDQEAKSYSKTIINKVWNIYLHLKKDCLVDIIKH